VSPEVELGALLLHSGFWYVTGCCGIQCRVFPATALIVKFPALLFATPDDVRVDCEMLYTIVVVLVILWLLGLVTHVAGSFIHLLLVVALVILIFNLISGRR
jgi:hypothetical protein